MFTAAVDYRYGLINQKAKKGCYVSAVTMYIYVCMVTHILYSKSMCVWSHMPSAANAIGTQMLDLM